MSESQNGPLRCPARYTDLRGKTYACTLMEGHELMEGHDSPHEDYSVPQAVYWAHWASDKPGVKPSRGRCEEEVENPGRGDFDIWLDCDLELGHTGLHRDGTVHVDWEKS